MEASQVPEVEKVGPKEYTHEATEETFPTKKEAITDAEFQAEQQRRAALQGGGVVPETRPQAFVQPASDNVSDSSKRLDSNTPPTQEGYDTANSDKAKKDSEKNSRTPRLYEGQRVVISGGPEEGRMGYVLSVVYKDGVNEMMARTGVAEARFAEVSQYILRTRDGRSDVLQVDPDHVKPLDDIEGWGRGQI